MGVLASVAAGLLWAQAAAADGAARYVEVPLKGGVGEEITAPGVRDAIHMAKTKKADCVVFLIDTPGGRVLDADAIARVMDQERTDLKYYAVVTRAISAAVWPLSRMDRIFFAPGSAAGAAVAFSMDLKTGEIEVDAKFNAAMTAQVAAAAESHGQPGCVYRAMMLKDATLYRWRQPNGKIGLGETAPAGAEETKELDSRQTVLAWTAQQAAECGFGTIMTSADTASLGGLLGIKEWTRAGEPAAQPMARWYKEVERAAKATEDKKKAVEDSRKAVVETARRIAGQVDVAVASDPAKNITVYYKRSSGEISAQAQAEWRAQTDKAIRDWNGVLTLLSMLQDQEKTAANMLADLNKARAREWQTRLYNDKPDPIELEPVEHGIDIKAVRKEVEETIRRLERERSKTRL